MPKLKIFIIGFMGSGKTYWGKRLSEKINLPFFDLDELIEQHENESVDEIISAKGETWFRSLEKETLENFTKNHNSFILSTGGGTPCFLNNIEYLKKNGYVICLNAEIEILYQRLKMEKQKRPLIKNLNDKQLKDFIVEKLVERNIFYQQADQIINEKEIDLENICKILEHE
ncbi:MAG: shikimate kinase [Chitinophagaceae bacterium]|nr:MAG: shikimate kinase [Chitinophagaceae bacterium]